MWVANWKVFCEEHQKQFFAFISTLTSKQELLYYILQKHFQHCVICNEFRNEAVNMSKNVQKNCFLLHFKWFHTELFVAFFFLIMFNKLSTFIIYISAPTVYLCATQMNFHCSKQLDNWETGCYHFLRLLNR